MIEDTVGLLTRAVDGFFQRHPDAVELEDVLNSLSDINRHRYDFRQIGFPVGLAVRVYSIRDAFSRPPEDRADLESEAQIRALAQDIDELP